MKTSKNTVFEIIDDIRTAKKGLQMKEIELEIRKICTIYDKDYFKSRGEENAEYSLTEEQFEKIFDLIKHLSDVHKEKHALQGKTLDEILEVLQWDTANSELHYLMKSYRTHKLSEDYENKELSFFNSRQEAKQEIFDLVDREYSFAITMALDKGCWDKKDIKHFLEYVRNRIKDGRARGYGEQRQKLQKLKEI